MYQSMLRFPGDLFNELDALQRQMSMMFGRDFPSSIRAGRNTFPAINMGSTPETIDVYAFVPGVDPAKLEVSVDKGLLTIAGERAAPPSQDEKTNVHASERFHGSFKRVIALPEDADPARVEANCSNGVLRLTIRKHEASQPRRIEIK